MNDRSPAIPHITHHSLIVTWQRSRALKKVVVITTGGTIAMKRSPMVGGAVPMLKGDDFMARLPRGGVDLAFEEFTNLPSSHLTPTQVLELGQRVESALSSPDVSG